jgi:hypothetical protein
MLAPRAPSPEEGNQTRQEKRLPIMQQRITLCAKARDLGLSSECRADEARAFKFSNRGSSSSLEDCWPRMSATVLAVTAASAWAEPTPPAIEWEREEEGWAWAVEGRVREGRGCSEESRREGEGARTRADDGRGGKAVAAAAFADAGNCEKHSYVNEERMRAASDAHQPVSFATGSRR